MTTSLKTSSLHRILRTLVTAGVVGLVVFLVLWYLVFNALTAALIAGGGTTVIVVGGSFSDLFETLLEMLANVVLAVLGAVAAVLAAILSIFN
jgi:hypothetical protein